MILGAIQAADCGQARGHHLRRLRRDRRRGSRLSTTAKLAATVAQQARPDGPTRRRDSCQALKGEKVDASIPVELSLVTKEGAAGGRR